MRCYLSAFLLQAGMIVLFCQTSIVLEAGSISYNNIDSPEYDDYSADISDCTSIVLSYTYSFSQPWEGSGGMETTDECCASCTGDVEDIETLECQTLLCTAPLIGCWDIMHMALELDGTNVDENLIGETGTTDAEQDGVYTSTEICTDGASTAEVFFTNMNSATNETNTFSNVTILCWEAQPSFTTNSPVCGATQNLDLIGDAVNTADVDSWEWTNDGTGNIDNANTQITFASNANDGETYTLTTTDDNQCTGEVSQSIVSAAFDAELNGGGDVCINNCTDDNTDVVVNIGGGTGPYTASFTVNGFPIPQAPVIDIDEVFRICIDPDAILPSIDESTTPITVTMPPAFLPINLELDNITDATGCGGTITNCCVNLDQADQPEITDPLDQEFCQQANGTIDLTTIDDIITDGDNSLDVLYFEDADFDDIINNPDDWSPTTNQICAVTYDGTCYSDFVCFGLNIDIQPIVDLMVNPIVDCTDGDYRLPPVLNIADIIPVSAFQGYFLDAAGTDGPYLTVPASTTEVFIYAPSLGNSCMDVSVPVQLDITPNPTIFSPGDELGGCGNVELPVPDGADFNSYEYNTDEDGTGTSFQGGQSIDSNSGINVIFLIMYGDNGCLTTLEIDLVSTTAIVYSALIPSTVCDSLILPAITPTTPSVSYFTDQNGMNPVAPGTTLYAPTASTLFMYDPTQDPTCAPIVPVTININASPFTTYPADTTVCESYTLDTIPGTLSANAYRSVAPIGNPLSLRNTGDIISTNEKIYIIDTLAGCPIFDSININIQDRPFTGIANTVEICEGFASTTVDFFELLSFPDPNGTWSGPTVPDFIPVDYSAIDVAPLPIGSYTFTYAIEDLVCGINSTDLTINVVPPPYAGLDNSIEECQPGIYNFMELISFPLEGGNWIQAPMDTFPIGDSTIVDMSTVPVGTYTFIYTIEAGNQTICQGNSVALIIDILEGPNAGENVTSAACLGDIVNIRDLLSSDADANGFFEPNGFLLSGDNWITIGATPDQTYSIDYVVQGASANCPEARSTIDIFLTDNITAGEVLNVDTLCAGEFLDLTEYVVNESGGGVFYDVSNNMALPNMATFTATTQVKYLVEGAGSCENDSIEFEIAVTDAPFVDVQLDGGLLCQNSTDCITLNATSNFDGELFVTIRSDLGAMTEEEQVIINIINGTGSLTICAEGTFGLNTNGVFELNSDGLIYDISYDEYQIQDCQEPPLPNTAQIEVLESQEITIMREVCAGQGIVINGVNYTESTDTLFTAANGCDSLVHIILDSYPQALETIDAIFCIGSDVNIFGTPILRDTTARFIDIGGAANGCDSIVDADIKFQSVAVGFVTDTICDGMPVIIEGETFDETTPNGTIDLGPVSVAGCDSSIVVELVFESPQMTFRNDPLCPGQTIDIAGRTYDEDNLTDMIVLPGSNGCDSTIMVDLQLLSDIEVTRNDQLCSGATIDIGGNTYDEDNLTDRIELTSVNGCDSTIIVDLQLVDEIEVTRNDQICSGATIDIGGNTYDENNLTDRIELMTANGCDSTIIVDLQLVDAIEVTRDDQLCAGQTIDIGGNTYDENNLTDRIELTTATGCDSTIIVDLQLVDAIEVMRNDELCAGQTIDIGGNTYDENNLTDRIELTTATGCDSTIIVDLQLVDAFEVVRDDEICSGQTIDIEGRTYDENNLTDRIELMSINGCDSTIIVDLQLVSAFAELEVGDICPGDTEGTVTITSLTGLQLPIILDITGSGPQEITDLPFSFSVPAGANDININDANCLYQEAINIVGGTEPNVSLTSTDLGSDSYQINLSSSETLSNINWTSTAISGTVSCQDCPDPIYMSSENAVLIANYTANGCNYMTSVNIEMGPEPEPGEVYIPDIFRFADDVEGSFYVQSSFPPVMIETMAIYDRWGNEIFVRDTFPTNDRDLGWNGTRDGKMIEQGVYIYFVKMASGRIYTGDITIIR